MLGLLALSIIIIPLLLGIWEPISLWPLLGFNYLGLLLASSSLESDLELESEVESLVSLLDSGSSTSVL